MIDPEAELIGPLKPFSERSLVLIRGQILGLCGLNGRLWWRSGFRPLSVQPLSG